MKYQRRDFLTQLLAAHGVIATGQLWAGEPSVPDREQVLHHPAKVKSIIFYYCKGGPSQAHTFDKPDYVENPDLYPWKFKKCGQSGLEISDLFPHLRELADELCVIRSGYGALADHQQGALHIFTGASPLKASLGAWMLYGLGLGNPNLPGHILLTGRADGDKWAKSNGEILGAARAVGSGGLPPSLQAQVVNNLEHPVDNLQSRLSAPEQRRWLENLRDWNSEITQRHPQFPDFQAREDSFQAAYRMQSAAPEAFDLSQEGNDPQIRKLYGLDPQETRSTGTKLLLARRLVERGVRFITVPSNGVPGGRGDWDTHTPSQLMEAMPKLSLACDQPLAGLLTDLKQRGLLDQTLVIWGGEMGRGGAGHLNHNGSAFCWWMAGGGVRSGYAHGATDDQGYTAVDSPVHVRDLHSTILWLCGLDHRKLKYNGSGFDESCQVAHDIIS